MSEEEKQEEKEEEGGANLTADIWKHMQLLVPTLDLSPWAGSKGSLLTLLAGGCLLGF